MVSSRTLRIVLVAFVAATAAASDFVPSATPKYRVKNVTLEMSLKPFKDPGDAYVAAVCEELFRQ